MNRPRMDAHRGYHQDTKAQRSAKRAREGRSKANCTMHNTQRTVRLCSRPATNHGQANHGLLGFHGWSKRQEPPFGPSAKLRTGGLRATTLTTGRQAGEARDGAGFRGPLRAEAWARPRLPHPRPAAPGSGGRALSRSPCGWERAEPRCHARCMPERRESSWRRGRVRRLFSDLDVSVSLRYTYGHEAPPDGLESPPDVNT
jgi:hypothetical protein